MGQGVFRDSAEIYKMIDSTPLGDMKWESFCASYTDEQPAKNVPLWMNDMYDIWYQDPKEVDFMSGDWAWKQADAIAQDPTTHGSTFVPIILGSDKTTILVMTGQNDYYPLYLSIGNIQNKVHHAHCNSVLFHASLTHILHNLKPTMTEPKVIWFGDGHYHCVIFSLGPYITDYEEQVLLACIVQGWCAKCLALKSNLDADALYWNHEHAEALIELQESWDKYGIVGELVPFTNDFPCADIYELIAPNPLHQIIKGIFKDHLVEWVENYLKAMHGPAWANAILDNINQRITAVAPFVGLHRFPEGCHFKQWTGNDLKALMKVYLPAIEGHVPIKIMQTFHALLEFTYLACHNVITEDTLAAIQDTIRHFHEYWEIFHQSGMVSTFSLPCQHAMKHYLDLIHLFRTPNGLCTSITESKHINAVKDPYWWTNCNKPLGQMLIINQCLDKLAASQRDFQITVVQLAEELSLPHLTTLVEEFLFQQLNPNDSHDLRDVPLYECPACNKIMVVNSAAALFYVPSDVSGIGGMWHEYICSCHLWQNGPPQYDCAFMNTNPRLKGMHGLDIIHVLAFFSFFFFQNKHYLCAVVQWFDCVGDEPDVDTGMWIICPTSTNCCAATSVIHVDTIYHAAHLIPVYDIKPHHSYDIFMAFYVNKFMDHHAFSLLSDTSTEVVQAY
ncbi:hypothetical protein J3A83DRAFT_4476852 [Scleroderma citrinum]